MSRLKQHLNLFHPVIIHLEKQLLKGRRYRKVVALTGQVRDDVMRYYDVPPEDIVVIPNGYSPEEFNPEAVALMRDAMRERLGFTEGDKVIGFIANESERKGLRPLVQSIASLRDDRVHLLAVGRLDSEQGCREAERLGLQGRVHFIGPTSDVAHYLAAMDVFALPTQYEAWGLVIVEALACGVPVLTSRLAGAAVAVKEGQNGHLLEDPNNAEEIADRLRMLLEARHASKESISESVATYRWSQVLLHYEQVLTSCSD